MIPEANAERPSDTSDEAWAASLAGTDTSGVVSAASTWERKVSAAARATSASAVSAPAAAGASAAAPAASSWRRSASAFARAASASAAFAAASASARRALRSSMFSLMMWSFGCGRGAPLSVDVTDTVSLGTTILCARYQGRARVAPSTGAVLVSRISTGGCSVSRPSTGESGRRDTGKALDLASTHEPSTMDRTPQDGSPDESRVRLSGQRRR